VKKIRYLTIPRKLVSSATPKKVARRKQQNLKNIHQDSSWALIALGLAIELSIQRVQKPGDALPKWTRMEAYSGFV